MNNNDRWYIGSALKILMDLLILIILHKAALVEIDKEKAEEAMGMVDAFSRSASLWATGNLPEQQPKKGVVGGWEVGDA